MSQAYDSRGSGRGRLEWRKLAPGLGVALALGAASAVSALHLVDAWREGAPFRAERAARAEADRVRAEAQGAEEQKLEDARRALRNAGLDEDAAPLVVAAKNPSPVLTVAPPAPRPREPVMQPARWVVAPAYRFRDSDIAAGVDRASVRFSCTLRPDGRLTGCRASETPAGAGLAALALPALADARMEPVRQDGRPVASTATVSLSWERQPRRPVTLQPAPPRPLVSSDRPLPTQSDDAPAVRLIPPNEATAAPSGPAAPAEPGGTPPA